MEGSCEYIEQAAADERQGVALQLGGWGSQHFTVKNNYFTTLSIEPRTRMDFLDK
jgi:hypothetical protein